GDLLHEQRVDVDLTLGEVRRVGDRALDELGDRLGRVLRGELEDVQGRADLLAAHQCRDLPELSGRDPDVTQMCLRLHRHFSYFDGGAALTTFFSAEWPMKVRVGANSPSL